MSWGLRELEYFVPQQQNGDKRRPPIPESRLVLLCHVCGAQGRVRQGLDRPQVFCPPVSAPCTPHPGSSQALRAYVTTYSLSAEGEKKK